MIWLLEGMLWLLRFFLGASVFSFLSAAAFRLPRKESLRGRSHCEQCGRQLTARELIPCISYLALGRKCRGCGGKIAAGNFWMEVLGGLLFLACGSFWGFGKWELLSQKALLDFLYLGILAIIAVIDWKTKLILDRFQIAIGLLGLWALWLFPEHSIKERMFGAVIIAVPMLLLALAVEGAFGGGDIKLMAVSGFLLGPKALTVAMLCSLICGGIYCGIMLCQKKLGRKDAFAFGPFLALGLGVALFWGDRLADWYLALLF